MVENREGIDDIKRDSIKMRRWVAQQLAEEAGIVGRSKQLKWHAL